MQLQLNLVVFLLMSMDNKLKMLNLEPYIMDVRNQLNTLLSTIHLNLKNLKLELNLA